MSKTLLLTPLGITGALFQSSGPMVGVGPVVGVRVMVGAGVPVGLPAGFLVGSSTGGLVDAVVTMGEGVTVTAGDMNNCGSAITG